ncbi:MAG: GAF domain-containing protein [Chloroflexi bacterium]|nr:GAF domain-containing protein [Chloroflexota bacterium]
MLSNFFKPPTFQDDPEKSREAGTTFNITLFLAIISIPSALLTYLFPLSDLFRIAIVANSFVVTIFWLGCLAAIKRGHHRIINVLIITLSMLLINGVTLMTGGLGRATILINFVVLALAFLLLPRRGIVFIAITASLISIGIYLANITGIFPPPATPAEPIELLIIFIFTIVVSAIVLESAASLLRSTNTRAKLSEAGLFSKINELEMLSQQLESQVASRTRDLELAYTAVDRRAKQFEAISLVSRSINETQNLQELLPRIAQVINEQFGFYHIGIFLLDGKKEYAVLAATNSEGGKRMLARNHKLRIGQEGIVGNVSMSGTPRIALDTGADAVYFNNPDLPETRSEIALPLFRGGSEIMGILDVQSDKVNAFGQEDIQILTTLADQVSIAMANARLYEETQKALLESETLYRRDIRAGWTRFSKSQKIAGIQRQNTQASLLQEPLQITGAEEVSLSGNIYQIENAPEVGEGPQLTIPMKLRGEVVGLLNIKSRGDRVADQDEMDIINAILERAALSMDNARLLAESRKAAEKERVIGEIASKVSSYSNRDNILQAAVSEIGRVLPGAEVVIQIQKKDEKQGS